MVERRLVQRLAVVVVAGLVGAGCGGSSGTPKEAQSTSHYGPKNPLGVTRPVVSGPVRQAEEKLVTGAGRPLHLSADLTDPQAPGAPGTVIKASGEVEFSRQLAEWTASLPDSYGGATSVVYAGGNVYVQSAALQVGKKGPKWLLFTPADMAHLGRLGLVANLVVQWDPFVAIALQAAVPASRAPKPTASSTPLPTTAAAFTGRPPGAVLVDDSIPGCSSDDSDSTDYDSTVSLADVESESNSDFEEFLGQMQIWDSISIQATVADGDLYELAVTSHLADGVTQIAGGITFCSAAGAIKTLATPSDEETESENFLKIDPCVVGTWELTTPVVEGITYGGAGGTVAGLEGSTMKIDDDGGAVFDFDSGDPMRIDANPDDSVVLASAEFQPFGVGDADLDNATQGFASWASTTDVLDDIGGTLATTVGVQYTSVDPDLPTPPGVGPTLGYGEYTCSADALTMAIPVGGDDDASFTRMSALDTAGFDKAMDDLNEALEKMAQLASLSDFDNHSDLASLELAGAETTLNAVDLLPTSCAKLAQSKAQLQALSAVVNEVEGKVADVSSDLSTAEDKITDQANEIDDDVTTAEVAAAKAVQGDSQNLGQEATDAIRAATTSVIDAKASLGSLVQAATTLDGNLKSDVSDLNSSAKTMGCH
jgi:hypothetical protein